MPGLKEAGLIEEAYTPDCPPLTLHATRRASAEELALLVRRERHALAGRLLEAGALLFRGFDLRGPEDLAQVVAAAGGRAMRYVGGDSPRRALVGDVYSSSEVPRSLPIPLHHEMSYLHQFPSQLWFHCVAPAQLGGETTIADARAVLRAIRPEVRREFEARGVQYHWSFRGPSRIAELVERVQKVQKSWMEAFETSDRGQVEARLRKMGVSFRWLASGDLAVETVCPALRTHPTTGEPLWFNQAHLFRLSARALGRMRAALARLLFPPRSGRGHHARYGDGGEISNASIEHLFDVLDAHTHAVKWQAGDLMWIDNLLCMHGRRPFGGRRRRLILVTMTERTRAAPEE
jgi:alpha-ketoglutarate-dependent taurine dioxygenase